MDKRVTQILLRKDENYLKQLLGSSKGFKSRPSIRKEIETVENRIAKLKKQLKEN
jgi:hypothetical protein